MIQIVPPEIALLFTLICIPIIATLLLVDRLERNNAHLKEDNIMLASRVDKLEEELSVWYGQPRKFLEHGLSETRGDKKK